MTYLEIITLIKDLTLTGAAVTGATVAIKGLGTWRRQLKGQSEYELSRRILVTTFKYRDAINGVRHPAMWVYEMPEPNEDEAKNMSEAGVKYYGMSKAYQNRWEKVHAQRTILYADLLEAEAIWENTINDLFKVIFKLEHELHTCVRHHLELISPKTSDATKDAILRMEQKKRDVLYDDLSEEPDEFKKDLLIAINSVENYLKPKLNQIRS